MKKSYASRVVRQLKASTKSMVVRASRCLLGAQSFFVTGVPKGISSFEGQVYRAYKGREVAFYPPKTVQEGCWHPYFPLSPVSCASSLGTFSIPFGIATFSGGNLTAQAELVDTFCVPTDGKKVAQHELFSLSFKRFFSRILKVDEPVISLTAGWQGAFYHWLWQILPRLALYTPPYPKIYVDQRHGFQKECIALLGLQDQVIDASIYPCLQAKELWVPEIPMGPTPLAAEFLSASFLLKAPPHRGKRLYLSRSDAKTRRVHNESEIVPILQRYGFDTVVLSSYSFQEQVALMSRAEMIVAPHGAGLAHLAFCAPGTSLLELFHVSYVNRCYWEICAIKHMPYYVLFDAHVTTLPDPDLIIDLDLLEKSLLSMLGHRS